MCHLVLTSFGLFIEKETVNPSSPPHNNKTLEECSPKKVGSKSEYVLMKTILNNDTGNIILQKSCKTINLQKFFLVIIL